MVVLMFRLYKKVIEPVLSGLLDFGMISLRRSGLQTLSHLLNHLLKPTFSKLLFYDFLLLWLIIYYKYAGHIFASWEPTLCGPVVGYGNNHCTK